MVSLSVEVRMLKEELSNAQCRSLTIYNNKNKKLTGEVSSTSMEEQICTGTPSEVADVEIDREVPPTEEFPQPNVTNIDMEREVPRPGEFRLLGEAPPPEVEFVVEDEEDVPLIIRMGKIKKRIRKRALNGCPRPYKKLNKKN
ncbi:uncharacterized protein A4U43_C08F27090 [Asparagus officinalis]|nr:uncharacterized protein A4U43_C08F27090 [Asparagus officinalis]